MNKLGLIVAGIGSLAIVALILSITLTADQTGGRTTWQPQGEPFTFDEVLYGEFSPDSFNGTWWSTNQLQWRDQEYNLVLWNVLTNETTVLVSWDTVSSISYRAQFVAFGQDKNLLLFYKNYESVWRHSFLAEYLVLDNSTKQVTSIVPNNEPEGTKLQYAQWIPQTNKLAMVYNNNIYVLDVKTREEKQITFDGEVDTIYNGIPDWVYEEEILSTNKAMYFSSDGKNMAFAQFNDSLVDEFYYTKYGNPTNVTAVQYPRQIMLKYPKVGRTNPDVNLMVTNLETHDTKPVLKPSEIPNEHIYTAVTWISPNELSVIWANRVQNESSVSSCVTSNQDDFWRCTSVTNPVQKNGWLDVFQPPVYKSNGGSEFLQILPWKSDKDGLHYPQIQWHNAQNQDIFISNGQFVVTEILRWDEENDLVYFEGTGEGQPGSRQMYTAKTSEIKVQCITCDLKTTRDEECKYNSIKMNDKATFYVHTCYGPGIPDVVLRSVQENHSIKYVFETNQALEDKVKNKAVSERIDMKVSVGNYEVPVMLKLPSGCTEEKKCPLLIKVYGGPGSQQINEKWKVSYEDYLSSSYGIAFAIIDGRGTGFLSNEYMFEVYRKLGSVEMQDQIYGAQQLLERYEFLDPERTAIWGWSYGGYATLMTLVQDTDKVFSCGLATAPVTDWLLYDSMYTERYMGLREDNLDGYEKTSLLNKVNSLRGKFFQINHGNADDNVHYQQAMLLVRALELEDIEFESHSYPDENHGLGGVRKAVYHNFDRFWSYCFGHDLI